MKQNCMTLSRTNGEKDFEQYIEELKKETKTEAYKEFQNFIKDKKPRPSSKNLCIEAYESILTAERQEERKQLNNMRFKEFERNRPPADKWYELKSSDFTKELYRNRVALKPNNSNEKYLEILQDPYLYWVHRTLSLCIYQWMLRDAPNRHYKGKYHTQPIAL